MADADVLDETRQALLWRYRSLQAEAERLAREPFDSVAQADHRRRAAAYAADLEAYRLILLSPREPPSESS